MSSDTVATVRGPIPVDQMGPTLMHEHVFVLTPDIMANYGEQWWDEELRVSDAVEKLTALKAAGIDTIVDPTVVGLGRYVPRIQEVNEQADINIIPATGLYTFDEIPHFFHYRGPGALFDGPEPMTAMFVKDITDGIGETGVKAAFLKGVVEERGITPDQHRVQAAICEAHVQTGVPITVHTNGAAQTGRLVVDFYRERGVDLTKVVIGHAGDSNDLDYLRFLMDAGTTIGCDRFGLDVYNPTDARIATIVALCAEGYAEQIVLAHDASCYMDFFSDEQSQALLQEAVPNWNYQHIPRDVLPALRDAGVSEQQITTMMVDNPRRYFSGVGR
ncbi:phosphotriesterase family protein [Gordonia shandongensis]|uniref:phosphotriesterase family protein n=1 Tax=Gordonia shandongensis TaxID=376351 RepID=UPI00040BE5DA|nr:phosphotriesterase [Gordonia shandongensis]